MSPSQGMSKEILLELIKQQAEVKEVLREHSSQEKTQEHTSEIIAMAWCDKTSFDDIAFHTGLSEQQVIEVMRSNLKRSSFKMWRKRVTGRVAKHKKINNKRHHNFMNGEPEDG